MHPGHIYSTGYVAVHQSYYTEQSARSMLASNQPQDSNSAPTGMYHGQQMLMSINLISDLGSMVEDWPRESPNDVSSIFEGIRVVVGLT